MRASRPLVVIIVVALLSGQLAAQAQAPVSPPAPQALAPYRIGYVSSDTTSLVQETGGPADALPEGAGGVDSEASGGGDPGNGTAGLVWISRGAATLGAAERDGDLWYLKDGATTPRRLTDDDFTDQHPVLSPDGRSVAFTSDRSGNPDIWVIGVDGTGLRRVTDDPGVDSWAAWSPSGGELAFSSTREDPVGEIYTMPASGGTPARITSDPGADSQPAWSPQGDRIAFTTTRFHPAGEVALVPVAGGPVTRAVPDPGDSAEPAWSPSGTVLAYTTHKNDPAGDVFQVNLDGGAVTPVSARSSVGETQPSWRRTAAFPRGVVVSTQLDAGAHNDIWSSDSAGGDRRDLTNRPGADEADPAFSPDGTRLAYTEYGTGDFAVSGQVVVSGADGSVPRPLTAPEEGGKNEREPTWSPDGAMIALTRSVVFGEGTRDSVRIVRVADGRVLGDIPIPAHLDGEDLQPAWSPDGSRIALTRKASRVPPPPPSRVDPATVNRPVARGAATVVDTTVHTDKVPQQPDIVLLIDQTGSMGEPIKDVKKNLPDVISKVLAQQSSAHFAVAAFGDMDDKPLSRVFTVAQQLIAADKPGELELLNGAIAGLVADGGGDGPEDWINALHEIATGKITFRPDSSKIVVLIGDAPSHDPSFGDGGSHDPALGHPLVDVIPELTGQKIRVVAVPVGSGLDSTGQATAVAGATNGVVTPTSNADEVAKQIVAGIGDLPVTIKPVVKACDPGLSLTFAPDGSVVVPGGGDAKYTETARVADNAPAGATLHCTVEFRLDGENTVRPGYTQQISVAVHDPGLPAVTVDNTIVTATGPAGAVITYPVTAVDAVGRPLTPTCAPPPGSTFPVGVTTVTCTATDAVGNTGIAKATMTVAGSSSGTSQTVWLVGLDKPAPDEIVATDQQDLSVRIAAPCASGLESAAEWSPDGGSLAFQHAGDTICVTGADGSNAKPVVQGAGFAADPAWSPDGALIAFTATAGEERPRIGAVGIAGGAPATLIRTPGGAEQPAFQRVPSVVVTASAVPPAIPFGGRTTVEFVVTNRGLAVAPAMDLVVLLPAGLRREEVSTTRGTCAAAEVRCALGALARGDVVRVRVVAIGIAAGAQTVAGVLSGRPSEADPTDDRVTVTITVADPIKPPDRPGSLSIAMAVDPNPGYVGGDTVVVTYTLHNGAPVPMPAVALVTSLPTVLLPPTSVSQAGCVPSGASCAVGVLQPGQTVDIRIIVAAKSAVDSAVSGTVTTTGPDSDPNDNTATARLVIRQPVVTVDPGVGPPGFVIRATGTDFPPGAAIRLTWSAGISQTPGELTAGPDGRFDAQVLIFHHDQLGVRSLVSTSLSGSRFGTMLSNPFLVVPGTQQPPFIQRQ
jgi:Tol biopolymer transport system component